MEKLPIESYSKLELRIKYKVSRETFRKWLNELESGFKHYKPSNKVLTPAQVKIIFHAFGNPSEVEDDDIVVKK
jgi:hypothetical protein